MSHTKKLLTLFAMTCFGLFHAEAQILKRLENRVKDRMEWKANQKVDKAVDEVLDGKSSKSSADKDKDKEKEKQAAKTASSDEKPPQAKKSESGDSNKDTGGSGWSSFSKFDFVPGEKVLAFDDFQQDVIGDFPGRWNTDASGETVTLSGFEGKWLKIGSNGAFYPEFIKNLPENFTLEFDLVCSPGYSYYSDEFRISLARQKNPAKSFVIWKKFGHGEEPRNGVQLMVHPQSAGGQRGRAEYELFTNGKSEQRNEMEIDGFHHQKRRHARVSIWRQNQRLRMYVNEYKVFDMPRIFQPGEALNSIIFSYGGGKEGDFYYLSNVRLAESAPAAARNKLVTEGRMSTTGILFDFQRADIKPESYNVIREVAETLKENSDMKLQIVGHTSNDGDAAANLELSKRRAAAVKAYLVKEFGIAADRLATDGKGGTQPVDKGTTPEAKANNRRVEFIRQ